MCTRCAFLGGVAAFSLMPFAASAATGDPQALELALSQMQRVDQTLWFGQLTPNVWIHTTTYVLEGVGYYPANGAVVVDGKESILIDTGWTPEQTEAILRAWNASRRPPITKAVVTHFHFDRVGGVPTLEKHGIPAFGNPMTIGLAIDRGFAPPKPIRDLDRRAAQFGPMELFRPGAGHTADNIVAWVPRDEVLFGGCLVKSTTSHDLGNLGDADVFEYPETMRRLIARYRPRYVIPGHGTIAGDSLAHTLALAEAGK